MEYQLVFSPRLNIAADDFVTSWNEDAQTKAVAQAHLTPNAEKSYSDPTMETILFVVTTVGLGLGTNALYDLIKAAVVKKGPKRHVKITKLDQPDGTHLLIFDEEEK